MGTRSTKSSHNKKTRNKPPIVEQALPDRNPVELSERTWRISAISILLVGAILRLYDLNLVPLHHDEGVNGNFLVRLVREHIYRYDPANYHGPTLYYFAGIIPWTIKLLFGADARDTYGLTTFNIRLIPVLFGMGTIALIFLLRKRLGTIATLAAALLVAISPGAVYLSRYFIHEMQFVFFTLGIVVAVLRFYDERRPYYILLAFISAALLFATKETAIISVGVLLIALVLTQIYMRLTNRPKQFGKARSKNQTAGGLTEFVEASGGLTALILWIVLALVIFVIINVVFYSSFFDNYPKGVYDSLKTFEFWTKTGKAQARSPAINVFHLALQAGKRSAHTRGSWSSGSSSQTEELVCTIFRHVGLWIDCCLLAHRVQDALVDTEFCRAACHHCRLRYPGHIQDGLKSVATSCRRDGDCGYCRVVSND